MPVYKYTAKDARGKTRKGMMEAPDEAALNELLQADAFYLITCEERQERVSRKRLKAPVLSDFCRELGTMLGAGVSLVRALHIISQQERLDKYTRSVTLELLREIRRGVALSEAMERQGNAFPPLLTNMFRAAEASGTMDRTAMKMAGHYEKEHRLNSKVKNAATYPILLGVVIIAVLCFIFAWVIPKFEEVFAQMELPTSTKILLFLSKTVREDWLLILIVVCVLALAVSGLKKIPQVRMILDRTKLRLPVIGKLLRTIYTARFARTLCSLYTSGIPIVSALQIGRNTIGNVYLESQIPDIITSVRRGGSLSEAVGMVDGFERKLSSSIAIGEETGNLDSMLETTADAFDFSADQALTRMMALLEPMLIIVMALLVGFIMVSIMMPLIGSYSTIEGAQEL